MNIKENTLKLDERVKAKGLSLVIEYVQESDKGLYICSANNSKGYREGSTRVAVFKLLRFLHRPENFTAYPGKRITLRAIIGTDSDLIIESAWKFNGTPIKSNDEFNVQNEQEDSNKIVTSDLIIMNASSSHIGPYSFQAHGKQHINNEEAISSVSTKLYIDVTKDMCSPTPCKASRKCTNRFEEGTFLCHCFEGFSGKTCSNYDKRIYGIQGNTYFTGVSGVIDINCQFGENIGTEIKIFISDKENFTSRNYVENKIVYLDDCKENQCKIECQGFVNGHRFFDVKVITFLEAIAYGSTTSFENILIDEELSNLKINGENFNGSKTDLLNITNGIVYFNLRSEPGYLQSISYFGTEIMKIVTCPHNTVQNYLLYASVIGAVFICLTKITFLSILHRLPAVTAEINPETSTNRLMQIFQYLAKTITTFKNNFSNTPNKCFYFTIVFFMNVKNQAKYALVLEIVTIVPHLIVGNYSWPIATMTIVLVAWIMEILVFSLIYSFNSDFSEGKKCSILLWNQVIPIMENELEISKNEKDQPRSVRVERYLTIFKLIRMLMKLCLAVLSFYFLVQTFGMESICLPKAFAKHWKHIEFQSHKKASLLDKFNMNSLKFFNNNPNNNEMCNCNLFKVDGPQLCFPNQIPSNDSSVGHVVCNIADCYKPPTMMEIIPLFIQLATSAIFLSLGIFQLGSSEELFLLKACRFIQTLWSVVMLILSSLYCEKLMRDLTNSSYSMICLSMPMIFLPSLMSPSTLIKWFRTAKTKPSSIKLAFIFLFLAGELIKCLYLLIPQYLLHRITTKSCLRPHTRNGLTFLPIKDADNDGKVLYFRSDEENWFENIKNQYNTIYRVVPTPDLRPDDSKELCYGQTTCEFFHTRTTVDHLAKLFLYYGYLALIQFVASLSYNAPQIAFLYKTRDFNGLIEQMNTAENNDEGQKMEQPVENAESIDHTSDNTELIEQHEKSSDERTNSKLKEQLAKDAIAIPYMQSAAFKWTREGNPTDEGERNHRVIIEEGKKNDTEVVDDTEL